MDLDMPMMTCDWCGREFPADSRACVEAGIDAYYSDAEEGEEWKGGEEAVSLPPGHFSRDTREQMMADMGLDDSQLEQLLTTGSVEGLGAIVCLECQDEAARAAED